MIVHYEDRDEVIEEGQAFYMPPGHVPEADADTEFVLFSPTDELEATEAAIAAQCRPADPIRTRGRAAPDPPGPTRPRRTRPGGR